MKFSSLNRYVQENPHNHSPFFLFLVGADSYLTHERLTDWDQSLSVVIYPINGDGTPFTADYITRLSKDDFNAVESFMQSEGQRYRQCLPQGTFEQ
jgi:hypothetical protein